MPEILMNNIGKKTLAITIAVILWIIANFEQDIEKNITIDIQYNRLPADLIITNNPPQKLNLRVRGSRTKLAILNTENYTFPINLDEVTKGVSKFDIRTDQIRMTDIQIIGLSPAEITVETDNLVEKNVAVKPNIGIPDIGFKILNEPKVEPETVTVSGPKSLLSNINFINTDLVSIEGEKSNFTIEVPLKSPSPLVQINDNPIVKITVDIMETIIEKEFKGINVNYENFGDVKFDILNNQDVNLLFRGSYRAIKNLSGDNIKVIADANSIKRLTTAKHRINLQVIYPEDKDINLVSIKPDYVEIIAKK